jgi:hypothetical protein
MLLGTGRESRRTATLLSIKVSFPFFPAVIPAKAGMTKRRAGDDNMYQLNIYCIKVTFLPTLLGKNLNSKLRNLEVVATMHESQFCPNAPYLLI